MMMDVHYMAGLYLISFKIQDLYEDYLTFVSAECVFPQGFEQTLLDCKLI